MVLTVASLSVATGATASQPAAQTVEAPASAGSITGVVTSLEGAKLAGIEVRVLSSAGALVDSRVTGADGAYQVYAAKGTHTLVFHDQQGRTLDNTLADQGFPDAGWSRTFDYTMKLGDLKNITRPTTTGTFRVGSTVTGSPGTWTTTDGTTFDYGWYIGEPTDVWRWMVGSGSGPGATILNNDGSRIKIGSDLDGKKLQLVVVASNPNWNVIGGESTSPTIATVAPAITAVKATATTKKVRRGRQVALKVAVTDPSNDAPFGVVEVRDGARIIRPARGFSATAQNKSVTIKVRPTTRVGVHKLKITYRGFPGSLPSSVVVRVRVTK